MPAYNLNFSGTPCMSMFSNGLVTDLTLTCSACTLLLFQQKKRGGQIYSSLGK